MQTNIFHGMTILWMLKKESWNGKTVGFFVTEADPLEFFE